MNDERTNQLSQSWKIPAYAQSMLWVATEFETVPAQGDYGMFTLTQPTDKLQVRWGDADGVGLATLRWRADTLDWTGAVQIGGTIDAIHYMGADDEETTLAIVMVSGQVLLPGLRRFPRLGDGGRAQSRADFFDGVDRNDPLTLSTWVLGYQSPLFTLCQEALSSRLNVYLWGRLVEKGDGRRLASPLILHELTLFTT